MESPVRKEYNALLTPPPSTVKSPDVKAELRNVSIKPKRLINDLKQAKKARKPRLKYRPAVDTVFALDEFVEGAATKSVAKDAEFLSYVLTYSKRIVVIQGAGVSVAAGIPDFRSANGLFTSLRSTSAQIKSGKDLFDFNRVYSSDSMCMSFNNLMNTLHRLSSNCEPTPYHSFINKLANAEQVRRIYTQNIDGLEKKSSDIGEPLSRESTVVQLHGSIHTMSCMKCKKQFKMNPSMFKVSEDSEVGEVVPHCPECKELESVRSLCGIRLQGIGKLKPNVILYNEYHPEGDVISDIMNKDLKSNPDTLLIVGTSLKIPGVRQMVKQFASKVRAKKGYIIWINNEMPPPNVKSLINGCDLIVVGDCQNIPVLMEQNNAIF